MSNTAITYYEIFPDGSKSKPSITAHKRRVALWKRGERFAIAKQRSSVIRRVETLIVGDIEAKRRFFEGAVVYYYAAQNLERRPTNTELKSYREKILDEMLAYPYVAPKGLREAGKQKTERVSTTAFDEDQWEMFFDLTDKALFEPAGFEFPDRKLYRELVEEADSGGKGKTPAQATSYLRNRLDGIIKKRNPQDEDEKQKKISALKQDLEYEEMQLEIAEEHPTDTAQFRSGMQKSRERIRDLKEEIRKLEQ